MIQDRLNVLMIGDVTGSSGMGALFLGLSSIIKKYNADFVILNGENASDGYGISIEDYNNFKRLGVDVITSGNHIWQKDEIFQILEHNDDILRPINYPEPCIGIGYTIKKCKDIEVGVVNAQGRVNMPTIDDPFKKIEMATDRIRKRTPIVLVDFHAEASEEKEAVAFYLDGKISALVGTHTHVQTADERILPKGCAYITDIGITGVPDEVIGFKSEISIKRQLSQIPIKNEVSDKKGVIQGVFLQIDTSNGKTLKIERFSK